MLIAPAPSARDVETGCEYVVVGKEGWVLKH